MKVCKSGRLIVTVRCGGRCSLMVSALVSGSGGPGSSAAQALEPTSAGHNPAMDWHHI